MARPVTLEERAKDYGCSPAKYLRQFCTDSVVTALCSEECDVEPDGRCPHGFPSPLIVEGLI